MAAPGVALPTTGRPSRECRMSHGTEGDDIDGRRGGAAALQVMTSRRSRGVAAPRGSAASRGPPSAEPRHCR